MIELSNSKKTYLGKTPEGRNRWALDCSIGAVQFREKGGEWQDIDPSIEESDSEGFSVKFTKVPYLGRIANDSRRRIYPDRTNLDCWIEFQKPYVSMGLPTRQDRWFYWNFTNAILGIRFDNTSIKFGFRLKNSNAPTSITIPFTTQGITRQGRFLYHTENTLYEDAIAELRKPVATDANGEERECEVTFGTGEVTVSLDTTGLTFPIDIDPTLDLQVGANLDDVHELESTGAVTDTTNVIHMASTVSAGRSWGAHRWTDVDIPEGATIDVAYAELYIYSAAYDDANVNLHFEKVASPAQFTTNDDDVTERYDNRGTTASTSWIDDSIGIGDFYQTPSLVTPLQEVVTSYSPTALVLIARPNQDALKRLYSYSHNQGSQYAAKLHIEWTAASNTILLQVAADLDDVHEQESSGDVTDDAIWVKHTSGSSDATRYWGGHRWTGLSIPLGATIDKAYIQVYFLNTSYDDIKGSWHFEELAAPAQFTTANNNVISRDRTETSVAFEGDSLAEGWVQTAELKTALQEVVDNYALTTLVALWRPNTVAYKVARTLAHNYDSTLAARIFIKWTISVTQQACAGTLASSGALVKLTDKDVGEGYINFVGALGAVHTIFKSIAGALIPSGELVKIPLKVLAGTLTSSGALTWLPRKILEGVITPSGILSRNIYKAISGVLSSTGAITAARIVPKAIGGVLNLVGTLGFGLADFFVSVDGALSLGGSLIKKTIIGMGGTLTSAGSLTKKTTLMLEGLISYMAGALQRNITKTLAGVLTPTGEVAALRFMAVAISGTLTMAGAVSKSIAKSLAGTLTLAGIVSKWVSLLPSGTLSFAGGLVKKISKIISGVLSFLGGLAKVGQHFKMFTFTRPCYKITTETKPCFKIETETNKGD